MLGTLGTAWSMVMAFWFGTIVWLIAFMVLVWALYF